jgi:hypothetical protein
LPTGKPTPTEGIPARALRLFIADRRRGRRSRRLKAINFWDPAETGYLVQKIALMCSLRAKRL